MLRRDSPTPREHMSERLWMRDRMTLLHSVCHHHEFVKTSHRGSHETCSPQVLTEPKTLSHGSLSLNFRRDRSYWKSEKRVTEKRVKWAAQKYPRGILDAGLDDPLRCSE